MTITNGKWQDVEYPKFSKLLSQTEKRRLLRKRVTEGWIEVKESLKDKKVWKKDH